MTLHKIKHYESNSADFKEELNIYLLWLILLTRRLQDFLDLADGSLLLFI